MAIINSLTSTGIMKTVGDVDEVTINYTNQGSMQFNSTNGITVTGTINNWGTGDFTVECWLNCSVNHTSNFIICFQSDGSTGGPSLLFGGTTSGYLGWAVGTEGTGITIEDTVNSSTRLTIGTWHHIAYTRQSGTGYLYVDGIQVGTGVDATNYSGTNTSSSIGGYYTFAGSSFSGYISNVRITNGIRLYTGTFTPSLYPLTTTQTSGTNIAAITNTSSVRVLIHTQSDISTNAFTVIYNNSPSMSYLIKPPFISNSKAAGYSSIYFNGKSSISFTTIGVANFSSSDFTIESWVYPTTDNGRTLVLNGTNDDYTIFSTTNSATGFVFSMQADRFAIGRPGTGDDRAWVPSGATLGTRYFQYNTWYHIAVSKSSTTYRGFVNGVLATASLAVSTTFSVTGGYVGARSGAAPTNYFSGYISNLRIIKGTGVYTAAFTPIAAPLSSILGTSLLTAQSKNIYDTSRNVAFTSFVYTDVPVTSSLSPFTLNAIAVKQTSAGALQTLGNIDEVSLNSDFYQGSIYFGGTVAYLGTVKTDAISFNDTTNFTIEGWVFNNDATMTASISHGIFQMSPSTTTLTGAVTTYAGAVEYNQFMFSNGTSSWYGGDAVLRTWTHYALSRKNNIFYFYIDGVLKKTIIENTAVVGTNWANYYLFVGGYNTTSTLWKGYISNFRIVRGTAVYSALPFSVPTSQLTTTSQSANTKVSYEVKLLTAQSATIVDNSSYARTIVNNYGVTAGNSIIPFANTYSYQFNGTTQYLNTQYSQDFSFGYGNFTIEFWTYTTLSSGRKDWISIKSSVNSSAHVQYGIYYNTAAVVFYSGSNSISYTVAASTFQNTWKHIAVIRDKNITTLYVDGLSVANTTTALNLSSYYYDARISIGKDEYSSNYFNGYMSNIRIVSSSSVYSAPFTPAIATEALTKTSQGATQVQVKLLTAQSSTLIDNSDNAYTVSAIPTITSGNSVIPFANTYSYQFNDSLTFLQTDRRRSMAFCYDDFTIEFWVYLTTTNTPQHFLSMVDDGNLLIYYSGGLLVYSKNYNYNISITHSINIATFQNSWRHIAVVRFNGYTRLFFNGTRVGEVVDENFYTASSLYIGGNLTYTSPIGYISNLRIVNGVAVYPTTGTTITIPTAALTTTGITRPSTVLLTAQSATIVDNSPNPMTITNSIMAPVTTTNAAGNIPFNGTYSYAWSGVISQYLDFSPNAGPVGYEDFTFEFWTKQPWSSYIGQGATIFEDVNASNSTFQIVAGEGILALCSRGYFTFLSYDMTSYTDTWVHIAFTRSASEGLMRLYVNGISVASINDVANFGAFTPRNNFDFSPTYGSPPNWRFFPMDKVAYFSNIRIVRGVSVYTGSSFTVPTSALTSSTTDVPNPVKLLTAQSASIIDNSAVPFVLDNYPLSGIERRNQLTPFDGTYSYAFNGNNSLYISNNGRTFSFEGDFTIECWFNYSGSGKNDYNSSLVSYADTRTDDYPWYGWSIELPYNSSGVSRYLYVILNYNVSIKSNTYIEKDRWYHVAVVRSGSTVNLYIDGIFESSTTISAVIGTSPETGYPAYGRQPLRIGVDRTNNGYLTGYISNLRIVKGTAVYTANFTPPTTPLTAISGTRLLTCQSSTIVDNSLLLNLLNITGGIAYTDVLPVRSIPFDNTYSYGYSYGASITCTTVPTASLALTGNFTIEFWFIGRPSRSSRNPIMLSKNSQYATSFQVYITYRPSTAPDRIGLSRNGSGDPFLTNTSNIVDNTWYHFALVRVGSNVAMYINGLLESNINDAATYDYSNLTIGANPSDTNVNGPFYGTGFGGCISNLRIVNGSGLYAKVFTLPTTSANIPTPAIDPVRMLTAQSSTFVDNSSSGLTFSTVTKNQYQNTMYSIYPVQPVNTIIPFANTYSWYFNDSNTVVTIPGVSSSFAIGTNNFTYEVWVYLTSSPDRYTNIFSGDDFGLLFGRGESLEFNYGPWFRIDYSTANIGGFTTELSLFTWYHIAVTRESGTARMFINGILKATVASSTYIYSYYTKTIGGSFYGYISNLRVINGTSIYSTSSTTIDANIFTPPTSALTTSSQGATPSQVELLTCQDSTIIDNGTGNSGNPFILASRNVGVRPLNSIIPFANTYSYEFGTFTSQFLWIPAAESSNLFVFTGDFTIEAWIYIPVTVPSGTVGYCIFGSTTASPFMLRLYNSLWQIVIAGSATNIGSSSNITPNTWYHIALVRYGSTAGNIKIYINGTSIGSTTNTTTIGTANIVHTVGAGSNVSSGWDTYSPSNGGSNLFGNNGTGVYSGGYISNLRIVKGTAVYTANFAGSVPTTPLTDITNTVLLTCQSASIVDNSINNLFVYTLGNVSTNSSVIPYNGTYSFKLSGAGLESPATSGLNLVSTSDFTVECWVNPKSVPLSGNTVILSLTDTTSGGGKSIRIYQNYNSTGYGFGVPNGINDAYGQAGTTTSPVYLPLSTWTHLALTRSGRNVNLYNNGSLVAYVNLSFIFASPTTYKLSTVRIGYDLNLGAELSYFLGYVSNLRITSGPPLYELQSGNFTPSKSLQDKQGSGTNIVALTGDEATVMLSASPYNFLDTSSKNTAFINYGSIGYGNTPLASHQNPVETSGYYSNYFNTTHYLTIPANAAWAFGTGDFTVECWVFITTALASAAFVGSWTGTASTSAWVFTQGATTTNLRFGVSDGTTNTFVESTGGLSQTNTWYHIAAVRSSGTLRLYSNGVSFYSGASATNISVSSQTLQINGINGLTSLTTGYISNLRIVKGAAVYTSTFTPSTTPLTNITNTVLLTCQSLTFIDNGTANGGVGFTITPVASQFSTGLNFKPFPLPSTPTISSGTTIRRQYNTGDYQVFDSFDEWGLTSSIVPSTYFISEGSTVTFSIYLKEFGTGTAYWTNSGTTATGDFSDSVNSGSISITNDLGTLSRTLSNDATLENGETVTIQIRSVSISGTILVTSTPVWVYDTSTGIGQALAAYPTTISGTGITNTGTGTFNWICPPGVTSVSVVAVGGGGGGGSGAATTNTGVGGGGGGLGWKNNISVTPGNTYSVVTGAGGTSNYNAAGTAGGDSYFINTSTVKGGGGAGGNVTVNNGVAAGRDSLGGTYTGDGGGNGGKGGGYISAAAANKHGGGGGGAGGYAGAGGNGAIGDILTGTPVSGTAGAGGGGGGGGYINILAYSAGGPGGGVNLYGQGDSGDAGSNSVTSGAYDNTGGWGGSYTGISSVSGAGGINGLPGTANATVSQGAIIGAIYGGGASGPAPGGTGTPTSGAGGAGAVRIIWGSSRSFPSTNTGDL